MSEDPLVGRAARKAFRRLRLWFTALFGGFAEAIAERPGKARAEALRRLRRETMTKYLEDPADHESCELVPAIRLRTGDFVIVTPGDVIPGDGNVVEGVASVDESVATGESAPVVRESAGDRSAVIGGTKVLSGFLVIRIMQNPDELARARGIFYTTGHHPPAQARRSSCSHVAVSHAPDSSSAARCSQSPLQGAWPLDSRYPARRPTGPRSTTHSAGGEPCSRET